MRSPSTCISTFLALASAAAPAAAQCVLGDLQPSNLPTSADFGAAVAQDGDSLFVGAPGDTTNGNPTGAVYWYRRTGPLDWVLEDRFPGLASGGRAVAVDGNWAAYSTGGGVQLLVRSGPQTWSYEDFIPGTFSEFGDALDLQDGPTPRLVIGMPLAAVANQTPQVWQFTGAGWVHEHTFAPLDGELKQYGHDVAIDDPYVLVGAPNDFSAGPGAGAVYVYYRSGGGTWVETQELLPSFSGPKNFGKAIDASAEGLIVGSPASNPLRYSLWRRSNGFYSLDALSTVADGSGGTAVAMDGDRAIINTSSTNVRMIERNPGTGTWSLHGGVPGPVRFGEALDLDGGLVAIGRPFTPGRAYLSTFLMNDCDANGQDDLCDIASGTAGDIDEDGQPDTCDCHDYVFCSANVNSTGSAGRIGIDGSASISGNALKLVADSLPSGVPGLYFYGGSEIQVPFGDGFRCVGGATTRVQPPVFADAMGCVVRVVDFTAPPTSFTPGETHKFQLWYRDPMGPGGSGFNLTDGVSVTFCQ